jgi:dihydropteroate synthase
MTAAAGKAAPPTRRTLSRVLEAATPGEIAREIERTDSDPEGVGIMTRKGRIYPIRIEGVTLRAAPLLKQELLAVGGDSAHARGVADHSVKESVVVTLGTLAQYRRLVPKLQRQPFGLRSVADALERSLRSYTSHAARIIRGIHRSFQLGDHPRVMGVLNLTPDSFSDGGRYVDPARAIERAEAMIAEGVDVLDLGAESTRPGAAPVSEPLQWARLEPVIQRLGAISPVPISVDTRNPRVAAKALDAGADLINDVGGLRDPEMRRLAAGTRAPVIVMHMRGTPETMQADTRYADVRSEVYRDLFAATELALDEGILAENLLVDPGLGFGKSAEQSLELLAHIGEFRSLGYPVVLGASRKSFLGAAVGSAPVSGRLEAGLAAAVVAAWEGAHLIRTHDVAPTVSALRLTEALRRQSRGSGGSSERESPEEDPG